MTTAGLPIPNGMLVLLLAALAITGCGKQQPADSMPRVEPAASLEAAAEPPPAPQTNDNDVALIQTSMGEMVIEFWPEVAPNTVANFKKLARDQFYDGTAFHRVVKGFMIQGGDPLTKDESLSSRWGTGDPGYKIRAEFNARPHRRGVVSMARGADPDSAGCQFFIVHGDAGFLDGQYTAFGKLIGGGDTLEKIANVPVKPQPGGNENSRPVERVHVKSISIVPRDSIE